MDGAVPSLDIAVKATSSAYRLSGASPTLAIVRTTIRDIRRLRTVIIYMLQRSNNVVLGDGGVKMGY
jgi:hypothetical protein